MPRATSTKTDTTRVDLQTCPGGYVVIRRLDYGEKMSAQDMAAHIEAEQATQNGKPQDHKRAGAQPELTMKFQMVSSVVQPYIFSKSIVEHNLEDADGNALDFRKSDDVLRLDSTIAEEIEKAINDMNKGSLGNSSSVPDSNSTAGTP